MKYRHYFTFDVRRGEHKMLVSIEGVSDEARPNVDAMDEAFRSARKRLAGLIGCAVEDTTAFLVNHTVASR